MALDHEIDALAARAKTRRAKLLRQIERLMASRAKIAAFRACFLDEHGEMTRAGRIVLAELGMMAKMGVIDDARLSEAEIRTRAGARGLVLMLIDMLDLDETKLTKLATGLRALKETAHE